MTYANSRIPSSAQQGMHEQLLRRVRRHLDVPFRKPYADHNRVAFEDSLAQWNGRAPLILDAGCGVGHSTIQLARCFPEHWVIGVDQSADRLNRRKPYPAALLPTNMVFVRADLVDYWRLCCDAGLRLARHYILYPNPWPKIGHLARRWHAHPVFPFILRLGGVLECRSNWDVYIEEFAAALDLATGTVDGSQVRPAARASAERFNAHVPLTPFERKYRDSGQLLFRVIHDLATGACTSAEEGSPSGIGAC